MRSISRSQVALVLVVTALFATPAAALSLPGQSAAPAQENAANESAQPGAQMSAVVGVGQAEVDGAVDGRSFGQSIAAAESNESKAAVVAERVSGLESRLSELEQRRAELQEAVENGSMNRNAYEARTTTLAAQIQQVERQLNHSQRTTMALPEQARNAAGLNVTSIEALRSQAGELRGGEVAAIARGMAGPRAGAGIPDVARGGPPAGVPGNWSSGPGAGGPPDDAGPPSDRGPDRSGNNTAGP
jgi:hypothetical protein